MMNIVETFIKGKRDAAHCEDGIVLTPHYAAVIDGSTSKTPFCLSPTMRNGRYAMTLISEYIGAMPYNATCEEFCKGITQVIADEYRRAGVHDRMEAHPEERLCASAIVYSDVRHEVWMVGDCQAIVDGAFYDNAKPYEQDIARRRAALILSGMPPVEARRAIEPLLIAAMREGQNREYAVIDGTTVYMPGVIVVPAAHSVVLASDGYPVLLPTLCESEAALARQIERDPQNVSEFIATKGIVEGNCSFDDRAYIRLRLSVSE
ncbi:MAG: hypothetical protein MR900_01800 [Prevotella sp.]|nr:hypothetical protein [Prevotella sp.]